MSSENRRIQSPLKSVFQIGTATSLAIIANYTTAPLLEYVGIQLNSPIACMAAAMMYISGVAIDLQQTIKTINTVNKLKSIGIKESIVETNPLVSDKATIKELLSFHPLLCHIGMLAPTIIYPPLGIVHGLGSYYAAYHNHQLREEIKESAVKKVGLHSR